MGRWRGGNSCCGILWQGRACHQPFPAVQAAELWAGEDASFCWLQGRAPRRAERGFLHLSHTPPRAPLPGILALPVLVTTIPLGGMSPQAGCRLGYQPYPDLICLPMPRLPTSLPAPLLLTSMYRQPRACHSPSAHGRLSHRPGINACVCPAHTPASAGLPITGATSRHCPAHTQPYRRMPHAVPTA